MTAPQPDLAHTLATALLDHITTRLTDLADPPGRAFVCGEDTIPADDCCDGLVWVRVAAITPTDGSATPTNELMPAGTPVAGHSILLEAGTLRCAPTIDEQGRPPTPDEYTTSALHSAQDRQAVRLAVLCDLPADIIRLQADGQVVGVWTPIYTGDCAGGFLTTQIVATIRI